MHQHHAHGPTTGLGRGEPGLRVGGSARRDPAAATVTVSMDRASLVVSVHGRLDRQGAALVREAVEAAITSGGSSGPIEVDLRDAVETTSDGMSVLVACATLDDDHPMRFRFGSDPEPGIGPARRGEDSRPGPLRPGRADAPGPPGP